MAEKSTKSLDLEQTTGEPVKTQKPDKEKLEKIDFTEKAKCVRDTTPSTHGGPVFKNGLSTYCAGCIVTALSKQALESGESAKAACTPADDSRLRVIFTSYVQADSDSSDVVCPKPAWKRRPSYENSERNPKSFRGFKRSRYSNWG